MFVQKITWLRFNWHICVHLFKNQNLKKFFFWDWVSCSPGWPQTQSIVNMLNSWSSCHHPPGAGWDSKRVLTHPCMECWGLNLGLLHAEQALWQLSYNPSPWHLFEKAVYDGSSYTQNWTQGDLVLYIQHSFCMIIRIWPVFVCITSHFGPLDYLKQILHSKFFRFLLAYNSKIILCMHVCIHVCGLHVWWRKDNLWESVFFFHHVGPGKLSSGYQAWQQAPLLAH